MTLTRSLPYRILGATVWNIHDEGHRIGSLHRHPDHCGHADHPLRAAHWTVVCGERDGWTSGPLTLESGLDDALARHHAEKHGEHR